MSGLIIPPDFLPAPSTSPAAIITPKILGPLTPSPQQLHFLDLLLNTRDNIAVIARAGAGKTSLIMMGVDAYLPVFPSHSTLVCAYASDIEKEISSRLKARGYDWRQVMSRTVHGAGNNLLKYAFRPVLEEKKVWKLIEAKRENEQRTSPYWAFGPQVAHLVSLAKQAAVGFFAPIEDRQTWYALCDHYDVAGFDSTIDIDAVVTCAMEIYKLSAAITDTIDFDDMVLFPLLKGVRVRYPFDLIMADEAQDLSPARQALIKKLLNPDGGRLVIVGDPAQAIYGFSGADAQATENLIQSMNMITCPLSVSWRCARKVVELAQKIVPNLEAAPKAVEGEVRSQPVLRQCPDNAPDRECHTCWGSGVEERDREHPDLDLPCNTCNGTGCLPSLEIFLEDLVPGQDAILCRNNAPLAPLAYKLIRAGISAKILGRKIGEGLITLCQRWEIKRTDALERKLLDYRDREVSRAKLKGQDTKAEEVEDRVQTILEIIQEVNRRGHYDIQHVIQFIERLFADQTQGCVVLATYHKSKGQEWERVFLFEHYGRCPSKAARQEWQKTQEANLAYVAFTRAKKTLVFVG